jgi:glycosyltransferase involved in cell wall biosynthesis
VAERASVFDVIHFHTDWTHLPLLERLGVPFVTTMHGRLDLPGLTELVRRFPNAAFVSISENQRGPLPEANWVGTVYHGMPPDLLRLRDGSGGYLTFLGRLTPEKGAEVAIRLARQANMPLRIAAKVPRDASRYVKQEIEPHIDGQLIRFVGEVRDEEKQDFLANSSALLFPIEWPIWFSGTDGYAAQNLTSMWGHLGVGFGPASGFSICEFKEVRGCTSVGALRGI